MDLTESLHHPLVESVFLPLLLALLSAGLLRALAGPARAGAAAGLALVASAIWMAGWVPRPGSVMQRLPWIFAVAWLAGVTLDARGAGRLLQWLVLTIVWIGSSWWLGSKGLAQALVLALVGTAVIGLLLRGPLDRADTAAMAVIASLGLAGLAFNVGSLALFQFSLALAAALGGTALWLWPKPRIRFGAAAVAVAAIAWLALAQAVLLLLPARPQALALLALAFTAAAVGAPWVARFRLRTRPITAPLAVAVLASACVVGALALQAGLTDRGAGAKSGGDRDDAYYSK